MSGHVLKAVAVAAVAAVLAPRAVRAADPVPFDKSTEVTFNDKQPKFGIPAGRVYEFELPKVAQGTRLRFQVEQINNAGIPVMVLVEEHNGKVWVPLDRMQRPSDCVDWTMTKGVTGRTRVRLVGERLGTVKVLMTKADDK
jgi:hypothetical protein